MNDALESVSCKGLFSDAKLEKLRPILALKLRHYSVSRAGRVIAFSWGQVSWGDLPRMSNYKDIFLI